MAAIRHPHVVQVFDFGEHAGQPYFAMEFLDGGSFADRLKAGPLTAPDTAALVEKIARGVGAAHDLGIVHRDLKPANVLLTETGEPKVTDFGLAKRGGGGMTLTGDIMGTPHYMCPEQAGGRTKFVGPQADVWALGVILYECLTGARPFAGSGMADVLPRVLFETPDRPRKLSPSVPRDVELICLKCLEKASADRYPTATELADDLRRFAAGEPVSVRRAGLAERALKWARRKPTAAAAWGFSSLAVLLAVVVFVVFGFWRQAVSAKGTAEDARDKLDISLGNETKAKQQVEGLLSTESQLRGKLQVSLKGEQDALEKLERFRHGQTMQMALQAWRDNEIATARALLAGTREELRGWEYWYVHRLCHADRFTIPIWSQGRVWFSPGGSRVLTSDPQGTARVWDAGTGVELLALAHLPPGRPIGVLRSAAFSADESRVVTAGGDAVARVWDGRTGKQLHALTGHQDEVWAGAFSPDGSRLLTTSRDQTARVWDVRTGEQLLVLRPGNPRATLSRAVWSPDGSRVAAAGNDDGGGGKQPRQDAVWVWDARTGAVVQTLRGHSRDIWSAEFSSDGSRLLSYSQDGTARVWDAGSGAERFRLTFTGIGSLVPLAAFSPDGLRIVTASSTDPVRVWDGLTGEVLLTFGGPASGASATAFSSDGARVVTGHEDGLVRVWDARTGAVLLSHKGHTARVYQASFNRDGTRLVTNGQEGMARVWDAWVGAELPAIPVTSVATARPAAFSPDGGRLVAAGNDGAARVWDLRSGAVLATLRGHTNRLTSASFSRDGARVVTASWDKTARLWDAATGAQVHILAPVAGALFGFFSPDGGRVVTTGTALHLWDAATGGELVGLPGPSGPVEASSFSPDGKRGIRWVDGMTRVWDTRTGEDVVVFRRQTGSLHSASFSPDGTRVVVLADSLAPKGGGIVLTDDGQVARVWDARTGEQLVTLKGHGGTRVNAASFSPDGARVVTAGQDNARVWDARTGAVVFTLQGHTGSLTSASFSPDGTRVLTAGGDKTARVWDARTGAELLILKGHAAGSLVAAWSPDGARILTTSRNTANAEPAVVRVWDATPLNHAFIPKPIAPAQRAK